MTKNTSISLTGLVLSSVAIAALMSLAIVGLARADSLPGVEVNLGANGKALVRGAEVTSVSSTSVNAKTTWGSTALSWIVSTDSDTEFVNKNGNDSGIAEIAVGDTISFRGVLDSAASNLTVKAKVVKDWSKAEAKTKLNGVVTSINSTLGSFSITRGNATTSVLTNSSTKFSTDGHASAFADLFLNAKVKISGFFSASSSVFTASSVEIASSSKDKWTKDDAKEWRHFLRSKVWLKIWND